MTKIVAVNASPRTTWNTATLVREAAAGAESVGAQAQMFDLYKLGAFTGCVSCFACKLPQNLGRCVCKDALAPVLEAIRQADGLVLGTPNYLGDVSAGFRALYERLVFQNVSYKLEPSSYNERPIPVLFVMTSNAPREFYTPQGYGGMVERYQASLGGMVGPTKTLLSTDTLQVNNYDRYDWTMFDPQAKQARHEEVFPADMRRAFELGAQLARGTWE